MITLSDKTRGQADLLIQQVGYVAAIVRRDWVVKMPDEYFQWLRCIATVFDLLPWFAKGTVKQTVGCRYPCCRWRLFVTHYIQYRLYRFVCERHC
jgi:hypothetical protein